MGVFAAKQNDMVLAVDVHIVLVPAPPGPPIPTPLPHIFNGTLDSSLSTSVKIMGLPAATVNSIAHNNPPHIPMPPGTAFVIPPTNMGTVFMGSSSVFIDGKPAARLGDPVKTCNDPMEMPVGQILVPMCTVLVGGALIGMGQSADVSSEAPPAGTESGGTDDGKTSQGGDGPGGSTIKDDHYWECTVVDPEGQPVSGAEYQLTLPGGKREKGTLPGNGKIHRDGQHAGTGTLQLKGLYEARWSHSRATRDDTVQMLVDCAAIAEGQTVMFKIYREFLESSSDVVHTTHGKVVDGVAQAEWTPKVDPVKDAGWKPRFVFHASLDRHTAISTPLVFTDVVEVALVDGSGKPLPGIPLIARGQDGEETSTHTDAAGMARFQGLAVGAVAIRPANGGRIEVKD